MARSDSGDRGAVALFMASLLTAMLGLSALVVDVAVLQLARRDTQNAADLAALAAGPALGNPAGRDPVHACNDAFTYLDLNLHLPDGASIPCGSLPATCDSAATEPVTVTATGTGSHMITITYPVSQDGLADPNFEFGADDGLACERMAVEVGRPVDLLFARIFGEGQSTVTSRAVVRGSVGYRTKINPALLMLQRDGCGALSASGQGRVVVEAFDEDHPGVIAADAAGNTVGPRACSTNTNASGFVVYGEVTPSGLPSIEAKDAEHRPAQLLSVAHDLGSTRAAYRVPEGVRPGPTRGIVISRRPVDRLYNDPARPAIDDLRTQATVLAGATVADMRARGYTIFPQDFAGLDCRPSSAVTISDPKVFVNCTELSPKAQGSIAFTGSDIVVKGSISFGSSNAVVFPNARQVVVGGRAGGAAISAGGRFGVNTGGSGPTEPLASCSTRTVDDDVGASRLVIVAGSLSSSTSADVKLCQTFVYMAGLASPSESVGTGGCTFDLPCPATNSGDGRLSLFGQIDWSAPNQTSSPPNESQPFENLAFWTETSTTNEIKGQGATRTSGVYFLPNAHFAFSGQASQDIKLNAQFISKSLTMSGQGALTLRPNPEDMVAIPYADFQLIR